MREDNVRRSDDVVDIWEAFIQNCNPGNDLGDERWMILEQVVVAGFDTYRHDVVDACLKELSTMFDIDSSQRMRRLRAMKFEMFERYDKTQTKKQKQISALLSPFISTNNDSIQIPILFINFEGSF